MARLIKCPRCQSQIDVTSVSGGATVRCPDCGAMVRVPTGNTGNYPKVQSQVPQPAAASTSKGDTRVRTGGRQTELFRKMSGVRGPGDKPPSRSQMAAEERRGTMVRGRPRSNTAGLAVGLGAGAVALVVIAVILVSNSRTREEEAKKARKAEVDRKNKETIAQIERQRKEDAEEEERAKKEAAEAKKSGKPALQKTAAGYKAPDSFEAGASKWVPKGVITEVDVDEKLYKEYESMASSGKVADILKDEAKWFPCMIRGTVSENETIARASIQSISDFCAKKGLTTESGKPAVSIEYFNSAQWRAGEYQRWNEWYTKNKGKMEGASAPGAGGVRFSAEDPERVDWKEMLTKMRAAGGFDDPTTQEGNAFGRVQAMGPGAYPKLIAFIDNEDTGLGRAAVTVLNRLTGRSSALPNEATKGQIKAEWESFLKK